MTIRFHRTRSGELVVLGPVGEVKVGPVPVRTAEGRKRIVVLRLGNPFLRGMKKLVYGYLTPLPPDFHQKED